MPSLRVRLWTSTNTANKSLQTDRGPCWFSETFSSARAAAAERVVRPQYGIESGEPMASEDTWRMATAEDDSKPLIFRIRERAPSFAKKAAFPHLLVVSWQYEPPNDQGMPAQVDVDRMSELEDLLMPAFEGAKVAFLTVI